MYPTHLHINLSKNQSSHPITYYIIYAWRAEKIQKKSLETTGIEPATSGLQSRRSPSWATSPEPIVISFEFFVLSYKINSTLTTQNSNWARVDSDYRPHAYQACALTSWATSPLCSCIQPANSQRHPAFVALQSAFVVGYIDKLNKEQQKNRCLILPAVHRAYYTLCTTAAYSRKQSII